jgi:hypothetical protein
MIQFIKTTIREFLNEELKQKESKKMLKETFDSNSTFKRNVYGDDEKYREITKDKTIIWNTDYKVAFQYIFDNSEVNGYTFVHLYPYNEEGYNYKWEDLLSQDKSKIFIDAIKKLPKVVKEYMKKFGKLDKIVFRPKTSQMGNIYSSPSMVNFFKSIDSNYDVEIIKEDRTNFPKNTIIMTLKNQVTLLA